MPIHEILSEFFDDHDDPQNATSATPTFGVCIMLSNQWAGYLLLSNCLYFLPISLHQITFLLNEIGNVVDLGGYRVGVKKNSKVTVGSLACADDAIKCMTSLG